MASPDYAGSKVGKFPAPGQEISAAQAKFLANLCKRLNTEPKALLASFGWKIEDSRSCSAVLSYVIGQCGAALMAEEYSTKPKPTVPKGTRKAKEPTKEPEPELTAAEILGL